MEQAVEINSLLQKLSRVYLSTAHKVMLKEHQMTFPQAMVITQILSEPKTIGQITERLQLSYSTISGVVDRLERDGWIQRVRDQSDRRVIWIQGTDQAKGLEGSLSHSREKFFSNMLEGLDASELDEIHRVLSTLYERLQSTSEKESI